MDWYKLHHGMPYDARLGAVARRSGLRRAEAVCLMLCLLDHASRAARRGSVDGFDIDLPATLFNCDPAKVDAAMAAFRDKGIITDDNRLADWERQGVTGAERQRDYRARKRVRDELQALPRTPKKGRQERNPSDPDDDAETLARRKRLSQQAITRSTQRRNSHEGAAE